MNADRSATEQDAEDGGKAVASGMTGLALVLLAVGFAMERLADLEAVNLVTRILAAPVLLAAVVVALRRGARTSAILPSILLVLLVIYLGTLVL